MANKNPQTNNERYKARNYIQDDRGKLFNNKFAGNVNSLMVIVMVIARRRIVKFW